MIALLDELHRGRGRDRLGHRSDPEHAVIAEGPSYQEAVGPKSTAASRYQAASLRTSIAPHGGTYPDRQPTDKHPGLRGRCVGRGDMAPISGACIKRQGNTRVWNSAGGRGHAQVLIKTSDRTTMRARFTSRCAVDGARQRASSTLRTFGLSRTSLAWESSRS
jgi:hypothetical protein